jgi:hypothetical protein
VKIHLSRLLYEEQIGFPGRGNIAMLYLQELSQAFTGGRCGRINASLSLLIRSLENTSYPDKISENTSHPALFQNSAG